MQPNVIKNKFTKEQIVEAVMVIDLTDKAYALSKKCGIKPSRLKYEQGAPINKEHPVLWFHCRRLVIKNLIEDGKIK